MTPVPKWCLGWSGIALAIAFVLGLLFPATYDLPEPATKEQAGNDVFIFSTAIKAYQAEYGAIPNADPVMIIRTLLGDNPRKIVFVELRSAKNANAPKDGLANGLLYDPWGSPYRVDVSDPKNPKVWSLGKNKKDEHEDLKSDDICSWK